MGQDLRGSPGRCRWGRPDRLVDGERRPGLLPDPPAHRRGPQERAASTGRRRTPRQYRSDEGLGCSRGGLTCKIDLAGEGGRRLLALLITPGQWGGAPQLIPVMERIRVGRPGGGRPRTRPGHLGGDKACSSRRNRRCLRRRLIKHTVPEPKNQRADRRARGSKGDRSAGFDKTIYKRRNEVERTIDALKDFRAWPRGSTNAPTSSRALSRSLRSGCGSDRDLPGLAADQYRDLGRRCELPASSTVRLLKPPRPRPGAGSPTV